MVSSNVGAGSMVSSNGGAGSMVSGNGGAGSMVSVDGAAGLGNVGDFEGLITVIGTLHYVPNSGFRPQILQHFV